METGDLKDGENPSNMAALTDMVYKLQQELKQMKLANTQADPSSPEALAKVLAAYQSAKDKTDNIDFQAGIRVEDIPKDDYLELKDAVTFCAPFTGYAIADDRRKGHLVLLPYNKPYIFFEYQGGKPVQDGKHVKLMNLCTYTSQSKAEVEWLRNYTFMNTLIYESTKGVQNFDVLKAQKLSKIMTMLVNFEMPQIIQRCKEYNIPVGTDLSVMRTNLAMKMAEAELNRDSDATQRRLSDLEKEKTLLMQGAQS